MVRGWGDREGGIPGTNPAARLPVTLDLTLDLDLILDLDLTLDLDLRLARLVLRPTSRILYLEIYRF